MKLKFTGNEIKKTPLQWTVTIAISHINGHHAEPQQHPTTPSSTPGDPEGTPFPWEIMWGGTE